MSAPSPRIARLEKIFTDAEQKVAKVYYLATAAEMIADAVWSSGRRSEDGDSQSVDFDLTDVLNYFILETRTAATELLEAYRDPAMFPIGSGSAS